MTPSVDCPTILGKLVSPMSPVNSTSMVEKALSLHRDDPSPVLPFVMPIGRLMDDTHCRHISEMLADFGGGWMTKVATKGLWEQLPPAPGLYMFVWVPALHLPLERTPDQPAKLRWVLYVGKTGDKGGMTLRDRYKGEYAKYVECDPNALWDEAEVEKRSARLARYLRIQPLEYWYLAVSDRTKIVHLEKRLIELLSPPLNRNGRPRLQVNPPVKAF